MRSCSTLPYLQKSETLGTTLSKTGIQPLLALVDLTILKIYVSGDLKFEVWQLIIQLKMHTLDYLS